MSLVVGEHLRDGDAGSRPDGGNDGLLQGPCDQLGAGNQHVQPPELRAAL